MKIFRYFLISISVFLLSSCLVTLNPLFENKDYVQLDSILGKWGTLDSNKDGRYWEFVQNKSDREQKCISYNLITYDVDGGETSDTAKFDIGIGKIGKSFFMDIYPMRSHSSSDKNGIDKINNSFYKMHILKAYTIHKLSISKDTIYLLGINNGWYKDNVTTGKIKLEHVSTDNGDNEIITASTNDLKKFVKKFAGHKEVFTDTLKLVKLK
ncbi:MAG: hypothetical protein EPN82_01240 [Bacteroidetes bacterium]|nr:MAG: hypothetical protein EPN82_01240 [Bacteroidota bacterium]